MNAPHGFSHEQTAYIQGLTMGLDVSRAVRGLPVLSGSGTPDGTSLRLGGAVAPQFAAMLGGGDGKGAHLPKLARDAVAATEASGKKLSAEEKAKRDKDALELWPEIVARAGSGEYPKGTDVFLTKFFGLFYVAPVQDSYMCRLRIAGGAMTSFQLAGLANLVDSRAAGYADITTRANLQVREISAANSIDFLIGLRDLGIITMGTGADNIRNITASPLSGLDPSELCETIPAAKRLHNHILHRKVLYGLPRKFNIAYDGGGSITSLAETNDVSFHAVRVRQEHATADCPPGVYYLLGLGGITGHGDFARPTGVLCTEAETVALSESIVKVFVSSGDRTDRKKARLKYVLDAWGFEKFLAEVEKDLGRPLRRMPADHIELPDNVDRWAHVDVHPQIQEDMNYIGLVLPSGRMTSDQMRGIARIANRYGSGEIRLTVWQNLLIPNVPTESLDDVKAELESIGLDWRTNSVRAGLVACTGSAGCRFASAPTKQNAMEIAEYVEGRVQLDTPVNIHLTGCHNSCAQHYIGDIGLLACKVEVDEEMLAGYHVYVGGTTGADAKIAKQVVASVPFAEVPQLVASLLEGYLESRHGVTESFAAWAARHSADDLARLARRQLQTAN